MACNSCGIKSADDNKVGGCSSNNGCATGGCNRFNVYDWLSDLPFTSQGDGFKVVEVSFKNGSRKAFFRNSNNIDCHTGDTVVVETASGGYDVGRISLSGELVRLQMKKRRIREDAEIPRVVRIANDKDTERWQWAKEQEYPTMLLARVIARDLNLDMKIGDVEYQGDGRKATFYYTADDRVDFRELIRIFAGEFRVKIEMRQIGARQEAGRIGGIGACGRELCCSTWLGDFKSVSTVAARYQNLAINQVKLSGQCGRLKCCLNYELDTYLDALRDFPQPDILQTEMGDARLVKTDIFRRSLWYSIPKTDATFVLLSVEQVKEIMELNKKGIKPARLNDDSRDDRRNRKLPSMNFSDGVGETKLEELDRNKKRPNRPPNKRR
jgi:cell fate regulator YaaT (PSP1 superfamily)